MRSERLRGLFKFRSKRSASAFRTSGDCASTVSVAARTTRLATTNSERAPLEHAITGWLSTSRPIASRLGEPRL